MVDGASKVEIVAGTQEVKRLARQLQSRDRSRPAVVITVPAGRTAPFIDAEEVAQDVAGFADVYLLRTGSDTRALSDEMPDMTQVYGGAGRVYPVGLEWVHDPYKSPLRFAFDTEEGKVATRRLIGDGLRMANAAGLLASKSSRQKSVAVTGLVKGVVSGGERAIVQLDDRRMATVQRGLLFPDLPLDRVLQSGMRVGGSFDDETKRLDLKGSARSLSECLTAYAVGSVVLAQVNDVAQDSATLQLHPELPVVVTLDQVTSNPADELTSLMSRHEIVLARVTRADEGGWELSLLDVDDNEEPLPAPALLEGGPPWLSCPGAGGADRRSHS